MRSKFLIALGAVAALGLMWGCGDDEEDNGGPAGAGTGGAAGSATGGGAGMAGSATGGAAGSATGGAAGSATGGTAGAAGEAGAAGTAGAAGEAGAAGTAGTAGAAGSATCVPDPASHTDCQVAGALAVGHFPGKEQAKTVCAGCHTADLGKAAKNNCWTCHDPTSANNLHDVTKGGQAHKAATDPSVKGATNADCAGCHKDQNSLGGNTCTGCHANP